jgi:hypothetical protein
LKRNKTFIPFVPTKLTGEGKNFPGRPHSTSFATRLFYLGVCNATFLVLLKDSRCIMPAEAEGI